MRMTLLVNNIGFLTEATAQALHGDHVGGLIAAKSVYDEEPQPLPASFFLSPQ